MIENDGFRWRFTGIYGEPARDKKWKTWRLLRILNQQLDLPWLCAGDFNKILYSHEKIGGPARAQNQMESFGLALFECGLRDLGFEGDKYTWRNHNHDANLYIKERLDRAVGSRNWCARFPAYRVLNGDPHPSDHRSITIFVEGSNRASIGRSGAHIFKFEAKWIQEEDCEAVVNNAWTMAATRGDQSTSEML